MTPFLLLALATLVTEDLTCIGAGVLVAQHKIAFAPAALACAAGIFFGDLLLYFAGRFLGRPILRFRLVRRCLTADRLDRASAWLAARGSRVVLISRFTPGLRLPTYVAAGLLKTRFWTFAGYFLAAALLWTPVLVGATALLGDRLVRALYARGHQGIFAFALVFGAAVAVQSLPHHAGAWRTRRYALGFLRRATRWEFWPPWLTYLPLIPYLLYLGARYRCLTLFTAVNPGIPSSGFAGESKSQILRHLPHVPEFELIPALLPLPERMGRASAFASTFPVVCKPDVGERGNGVAIIRTARQLENYLAANHADTILQRYVPGVEFGVFYYRCPGAPAGCIFSITEKRFPAVRGDGRTTLADLILNDPRAVCLADIYLARCRRDPESVPAPNQEVPLAEIGSHCRGAIFLDAAHLATDALRSALDRAAHAHPGFYFGRFDLRAASVADFQRGHFHILELNGVTAEATHIYDPAVSLAAAYRAMFAQWRIAFEIAHANRAAGALPLSVRQFARLAWSRQL